MKPILFYLGSWPVRSFGVMMVIGFLLAVWRTTRVCEARMRTEPEDSPRRIHPDAVIDFALIGLAVGLIGARLLFVLLSGSYFIMHPGEIIRIWEGGISLHGAMLAGILFMYWFCRKRKISFYALADLGAVAWPLAYAFGRIGCLLNGCCYGGECSLPWAVRFLDERYPGQNILTPPSHPIQAYATIINLGFFFLMTRLERHPHRDGELFYTYLGLYGLYRGLIEFLRAGATSTYLIPALHLTETHVISLLMVVIGAAGILWLRRKPAALPDISAHA